MQAVDFKAGIMKWIHKNGFSSEVKKIKYDIYSSFDLDTYQINIGIEKLDGVDEWFEEFLLERGFQWEGIPSPVLQFLHELGHSQTIYDFSNSELVLCDTLKKFIGIGDCKDSAVKYWEVMDELAANDWLIDFTNNNIDAVSELCQYFIDNWEDSIQNIEGEVWRNCILSDTNIA